MSQNQWQSKLLQAVSVLMILVCIVLWRQSSFSNRPEVHQLPSAPTSHIKLIQASDAGFVYRLLLLWLQQYDVQSGQYLSYKELDYEKLVSWLDWLQQMEPASQYPVLLASRIYTKVADPERKRQMLHFVYQQFLHHPAKNWRWLAEATVTARHSLKDLPLAKKYAEALAESEAEVIPYWARDMRLTILEDMGEYEQAKLLVGGLLASQTIHDENELRFLNLLLQRLQKNHD